MMICGFRARLPRNTWGWKQKGPLGGAGLGKGGNLKQVHYLFFFFAFFAAIFSPPLLKS
jgi:hypothetical protein